MHSARGTRVHALFACRHLCPCTDLLHNLTKQHGSLRVSAWSGICVLVYDLTCFLLPVLTDERKGTRCIPTLLTRAVCAYACLCTTLPVSFCIH